MYIYQSEDSLMHFCWKDRGNGTVEDDLIIFPDDIEYKRVKQCTTGRVYILKFKSSTRKFFFWMQEPKTDKDEEYMTKVNNLLNNPPTPGSGGGGSGLPPALAGLSEQLGRCYSNCRLYSSFLNIIHLIEETSLAQQCVKNYPPYRKR